MNKAPFIKLLIPLISGIIVQHLFGFSLFVPVTLALVALFLLALLMFLPRYKRFYLLWLRPALAIALIFSLGILLFVVKDARFQNNWFGHFYSETEILSATILEKPVEKTNSYKADAVVGAVLDSAVSHKTSGSIIIYFKKDSSVLRLAPGTRIAFRRALQPIKNSGNPGAFNYKQYALFNGITHTVYLTDQDYVLSKKRQAPFFISFLNSTKDYVLRTLKTYIPGKKEQGLGEALLIGHKDDLDKDLLQSYTNTGVVHVIAVSGMHLALIFWILNLIFRPLLKRKQTAWLHPLLVLSILWLFTLLAGGSASIVRAAVMFTFILLGTAFQRKASVYNTLAASAFLLLCYNPYWLWDVGFQLSYLAVLSIVIFYKPVYHWLSIKNKSLDWIWQLAAVSIAAQILTTPVVLYHFHQFPVYFLITNLFIVPVSSFVLIGELILVLISPIPVIAAFLGKVLSATIWWMNSFIESLEKFPLAVWDGIYINLFQTILLFVLIAGMTVFFMTKRKAGLWLGLIAVAAFFIVRFVSVYEASQQRKIIVYNISKHDAIDFINGQKYLSVMDSSLRQDKRLLTMNIKPARTFLRISPSDSVRGVIVTGNAISFFDKRILIINNPVNHHNIQNKTTVDAVVLAGNPRLYMSDLLKVIHPKQVVISGSAPAWKAAYWQKDCDSLQIPCHNVSEKGAFVMPLR